jgi:uncharacterized protein (DUF1697 family)
MVAFLRGINVGNRRPKKDELVAAVSGPEFADVTTYQASGNVILDTDLDAVGVEALLEQRLEGALGYPVTCFVRSLDELRMLLTRVPDAPDGAKHEIIFHAADPGAEAHAALAATAGPNDTLRPMGRETLWTHVGGMSESPLAALTPRPGAPVTTVRTAATIQRLVDRFG